jgi:hypothetical protein
LNPPDFSLPIRSAAQDRLVKRGEFKPKLVRQTAQLLPYVEFSRREIGQFHSREPRLDITLLGTNGAVRWYGGDTITEVENRVEELLSLNGPPLPLRLALLSGVVMGPLDSPVKAV